MCGAAMSRNRYSSAHHLVEVCDESYWRDQLDVRSEVVRLYYVLRTCVVGWSYEARAHRARTWARSESQGDHRRMAISRQRGRTRAVVAAAAAVVVTSMSVPVPA